MNAYEVVQLLTQTAPDSPGFSRLISEFSYQFGWRPSDIYADARLGQYPGLVHLVTEHGLKNAAVLTFLPDTRLGRDLQVDERRSLLGLSYNNLVDWHLWIDRDHVTYLYNRTQPATEVARFDITRERYEGLSRERFEEAIGSAPNPNLPALDDALMDTLSKWKRLLGADLKDQVTNANLSALFNAILLARAVEDYFSASANGREELLAWNDEPAAMSKLIVRTIERMAKARVPKGLIDWSRLTVFDQLDSDTWRSLFRDFYRHQGVPYRYDFSVMSKHALSRIYERYVSILRYPSEQEQATFFAPIPTEEPQKSSGAVYTPEFIARFFAKYLQENLSPKVFRTARVADLACGSGIFLRTVLETQLQTASAVRPLTMPTDAVKKLLAVDNDQNACDATRLSLSVLHLVATGRFPSGLRIEASDAIDYFEAHPNLEGSLDAFVVNPPFIPVEAQTNDMRSKLAEFMVDLNAGGRLDSYLAFLAIGVRCLKPGGLGLFVLPQTFLVSQSAAPVRAWLRENSEVRCLVDLSHFPVFGNVGSYVVLLVLERKHSGSSGSSATIIRCRAYPGDALQDYLDGKRVETPDYAVFDVRQSEFSREDWGSLPTPRESSIYQKLSRLPTLGELADVSPGVITGMDDIFIVPAASVPAGEEAIYRPYLPARAITSFRLPEETGQRLLYPFENGKALGQADLQERFPKTWARLDDHRSELEKRSPVIRGNVAWWQLAWPRKPAKILSPKIVGPYVMLMPRFGLDLSGRWLVRGGYYVTSKELVPSLDFLKFALGFMNSATAAWFLARLGRRYRGGYNRIEVATLKALPIPSPADLPPEHVSQIVDLVDGLLDPDVTPESARRLRDRLDELTAAAYEWTDAERELIG